MHRVDALCREGVCGQQTTMPESTDGLLGVRSSAMRLSGLTTYSGTRGRLDGNSNTEKILN